MRLRLLSIMVRTDTKIEGQASLREIAAVFNSADQLEAAINELASNGWDRADMSLLAQEHVFAGDVSVLVQDTHRTADDRMRRGDRSSPIPMSAKAGPWRRAKRARSRHSSRPAPRS